MSSNYEFILLEVLTASCLHSKVGLLMRIDQNTLFIAYSF